jgi:hypothetical protein
MEAYEKYLEENFIQVLLAQQIGCVMAMISAVELSSQTARGPPNEPYARLHVPLRSRLGAHLQVCHRSGRLPTVIRDNLLAFCLV